MRSKHPMQQVHMAGAVLRFRANPIVSKLLDIATEHGYGMNQIVLGFHEHEFTRDDLRQLYQLIGYSLSGYSELNQVTDPAWKAACEAVQQSNVPANVKRHYTP